MALVTAQLLFVDQPDAASVQLDVILLDRVETSASPEVGVPLTFAFGLSPEDDERARALTVLGNWARRGAAIDIVLRSRNGVDEVELRSGVATIALNPTLHDERR